MSTGFTIGVDCIHVNLAATVAAVPKGTQLAGYMTGSGPVPWTAADWAAHPDAVRIDQSPVNTALNELADVLDVEAGAATLADVAPWAKAAQANFAKGARPGQRRPAIYASASSITPVANALVAGGVTSGVGLWVANWNLTQAQAIADVLAASGPYPVIGVQFTDAAGIFDADVFSAAWLNDRSAAPAPAGSPAYRHMVPAGNTLSLAALAAQRHTVPAVIADVTRQHVNTENLAVLNAYLDLDAALSAAGQPHPAMPAGMVYWTINP